MNIIIIKTQSLNNKVNNIHSSSRKALGAGANVLDRKIGAPCSSPVKVATQQTFSILMPIMKPPVGAQDVIIKTLTQPFRAFKLRTPNSELQTPNSAFQIPNSKLRTPNSELRTLNSKLQAPHSKLQTPNSKLQTPNSKLQTPNFGLRTPHSDF